MVIPFSEGKEVVDKTLENIIEWLRTGSPDAKRPIDWDWDVEIIEKKDDEVSLEAFHPKAYLKLFIVARYDQKLIKLAVDPYYPTKFLDNKDRLYLYYTLLKFNLEAPLVKASLIGDDDGVIFLVDLDARTLGKEEFNHALESLYFSVMAFVEAFNIKDEVMELYYKYVLEALADRIEKGESPEQLVEYLVGKVGLPRPQAEQIVEEVIHIKRKERSREEKRSILPQSI